jgi:mono/diheme cytochrome c family protein
MKRNSRFSFALILAATATGLFSCIKTDPNSPGYEYMPDMYYSIAYRPGEANPNFADGKTNQPPVNGTVAQSKDSLGLINFGAFPYANTPEGREKAILESKNPLGRSAYHLAEGERLYNVYCIACHGKEGKGDGTVVKVLLAKENYGLQPPAYSSEQLKNISEGQIFYAMHFGKGNMGSYASQLSAVERWQITRFVQTLQNPVATSDSTAAAAADTTAMK